MQVLKPAPLDSQLHATEAASKAKSAGFLFYAVKNVTLQRYVVGRDYHALLYTYSELSDICRGENQLHIPVLWVFLCALFRHDGALSQVAETSSKSYMAKVPHAQNLHVLQRGPLAMVAPPRASSGHDALLRIRRFPFP